MDAETFREILSEYLAPVGTINWMEYFIEALPSIVAIITVITTAVIQIINSKQETRRLTRHLEQQRELEHIRFEESRKSATHEFRLKHEEKLRTERLAEYDALVSGLYSTHLMGDTKRSVYSAYTRSVKLLSLCSPDEPLFSAVQSMVTQFENRLSSVQEITDHDVQELKTVVQSVSVHLNAPTDYASPTSDRPAKQPQ